MNTEPAPTSRVSAWDVIAIAMLGGAGCALSYDALRQMAEAIHVRVQLTYVFPAVIDGFIAYGVRALVLLRTAPWRARAYTWILFGASTAASIWANALHAVRLNEQSAVRSGLRLGDFTVGVLSTLAPLALAGAVHLYIVVARHTRQPDRRTGPNRASAPDRDTASHEDRTGADRSGPADRRFLGWLRRRGHTPRSSWTETPDTPDRSGPDRPQGPDGEEATGPADGTEADRGPEDWTALPDPTDRTAADRPDRLTKDHQPDDAAASADRASVPTADPSGPDHAVHSVRQLRALPGPGRAQAAVLGRALDRGPGTSQGHVALGPGGPPVPGEEPPAAERTTPHTDRSTTEPATVHRLPALRTAGDLRSTGHQRPDGAADRTVDGPARTGGPEPHADRLSGPIQRTGLADGRTGGPADRTGSERDRWTVDRTGGPQPHADRTRGPDHGWPTADRRTDSTADRIGRGQERTGRSDRQPSTAHRSTVPAESDDLEELLVIARRAAAEAGRINRAVVGTGIRTAGYTVSNARMSEILHALRTGEQPRPRS
ncbi:DUF2637 domain-containing protein [Streptacidiphilus griseoplanus]|uniref:DUF2637 domain-containing protein n=1 Tax=Peterkaempfera griseoplana TaxID=66896 RepID=UPI000B254BB6